MENELPINYTNDLRLTILENSLFHEYLITKSVGDLLEIEVENSYSLSDKSSALSLASKIHLLIDLKTLSKEQKPKLFYYLEIRNQFLHNWKCKTFENCFASLDKTYNALKKIYKPNIELSLEKQMTYCYNSLSEDIVDIAINHLTMKVIDTKVAKKMEKEKLERYNGLKEKASQVFLKMLESDTLKKYNISNEDEMILIRDYLTEIL